MLTEINIFHKKHQQKKPSLSAVLPKQINTEILLVNGHYFMKSKETLFKRMMRVFH